MLLDDEYFVDPESTLQHLMDTSTTLGRRKLVVPENCVFVPRVVFTPTRVIFFPREVMEKIESYDITINSSLSACKLGMKISPGWLVTQAILTRF